MKEKFNVACLDSGSLRRFDDRTTSSCEIVTEFRRQNELYKMFMEMTIVAKHLDDEIDPWAHSSGFVVDWFQSA